ncbi:MAG: hypothetical protein ACFFHD_03040 [Promethearchaeota archaeon]
MVSCNYPPNEILYPSIGRPNYEYIILWILNNNEVCTWSDLKEKVNRSTLSIYLNKLKENDYIEKSQFNRYRITSKGRNRFYDLGQNRTRKRQLSIPPEVILNKRNYNHIILWMAYNNNYLRWSDFIEENAPVKINQSSLSKNLNILLENEIIRKDEDKEYRITQAGKFEYSKMLSLYDLDRQSILDEESKRIAELTHKTLNFFEEYNISDRNIQFRFLNSVLRLNYQQIKSVLRDEEDFHKILLFLSINHPNEFPKYITPEEFSANYKIKKTTLNYYIDEIVENQIYPIKFFKLEVPPDRYYYFQTDEQIEKMLRVITEEHITKFTYLNKLYENSSELILPLDMDSTVNAILNEACKNIFSEELKESLREFLPKYILHLAYKIEKKRKLKGISDKLEGIIWKNIPDLFQSKNIDDLELQYQEKIKKINKEIEVNPKKIELYYSKIKILMYFNQYFDLIKLLDNMLIRFPEKEKDLKLKKAYILKEMRNIEAGLDIINQLIDKYPEDTNLLLNKTYWLQYLNKKEEALELILNLIEGNPENELYYDTYGEVLMNFAEYDNAIKQFQNALKISNNTWYSYQTYIKLGICYKELENYELAIKYLQKGKEITNKASIDPEDKNEWLAITELFLAEIEQLQTEF